VRELLVWWGDTVTGTLGVDRHGDMSFRYAPEWLADPRSPALSMSLPKRPEPFTRRECRPFFAGVLPEDAQRTAVARALGISEGNDFRLLEALGGDIAGALSLWPPGERPPEPDAAAAPHPLDDEELASLLDALPSRPLLAGEHGLRLSLAGAQSKLPVVLVEGRIALPTPGQPTTHILKPALPRFPGITENEALVMHLAAALDLPVPEVEPRSTAGRLYLLVTRYDRRADEAGIVRRLHQEDFCQALGVPPEHKYAAEGGPTFDACFALLRRACTRPAVEVLKLLDAAVFNIVAGNADAHGKNFSLLHDGSVVALAPFYDLVCTAAYRELSPRFAMKIGGHRTLEELGAAAWEDFASRAGLAAPFVRRRVRELADGAERAIAGLSDALFAEGLDPEALTRVATIIAARARIVRGTAS
jgi:serine/threonine-protein kinase HipA